MTSTASASSGDTAGAPLATRQRGISRRLAGLALGSGAIATTGIVLFGPVGLGGIAPGRAAGSGAGAPEREPVSQLTPVAGSGVAGTVRVRPGAGDKASVTLTVTGLRPGLTYVAQLYAGPPDAPSASSGRLGELVPDAAGRATLTATEARFGAAGATAPLTFDLLTDGDHSVAVVAPGVGPVASTLLRGQ